MDCDCGGLGYERCNCEAGNWYHTCEYSSCYDCYQERRSEYVDCIWCGSWHSPAYDTCYKCRISADGRDDAAQALRTLITIRDSFTCQECGVLQGALQRSPFTGNTLFAQMQVDHIVPCARGGKADEWNLRLLCSFCNRRKAAAWWVGCPYEKTRTDLVRRYFLVAPTYFNAETMARFRDEVATWRAVGTWDPEVHRQHRAGIDA